MDREEFKKYLKLYYETLLNRLDNGAAYVDKYPENKNAYKLYREIIQETAEIERIMDYYGMDKNI